jgi:hypothetical protein
VKKIATVVLCLTMAGAGVAGCKSEPAPAARPEGAAVAAIAPEAAHAQPAAAGDAGSDSHGHRS